MIRSDILKLFSLIAVATVTGCGDQGNQENLDLGVQDASSPVETEKGGLKVTGAEDSDAIKKVEKLDLLGESWNVVSITCRTTTGKDSSYTPELGKFSFYLNGMNTFKYNDGFRSHYSDLKVTKTENEITFSSASGRVEVNGQEYGKLRSGSHFFKLEQTYSYSFQEGVDGNLVVLTSADERNLCHTNPDFFFPSFYTFEASIVLQK